MIKSCYRLNRRPGSFFFLAIKCVFLGFFYERGPKEALLFHNLTLPYVSAVVHLERKQRKLLCIIYLY